MQLRREGEDAKGRFARAVVRKARSRARIEHWREVAIRLRKRRSCMQWKPPVKAMRSGFGMITGMSTNLYSSSLKPSKQRTFSEKGEDAYWCSMISGIVYPLLLQS